MGCGKRKKKFRSAKQRRAYYATKGWKRQPRKNKEVKLMRKKVPRGCRGCLKASCKGCPHAYGISGPNIIGTEIATAPSRKSLLSEMGKVEREMARAGIIKVRYKGKVGKFGKRAREEAAEGY